MAKPKKQSAGILLYRIVAEKTEFFLVHPGGPYWKNKHNESWTIPKGEFEAEDPLKAAIREFKEETGTTLKGPFLPLTPVLQKSGKLIHAWAAAGDIDPAKMTSNTFDMEWPPRSGQKMSFPEVDKGGWFDLPNATRLINPAQTVLLEELTRLIA